MEQFAGGDEVADKILNFNPYDANTSAPFFDPEIMFSLQPELLVAGYFDVIIGNPPYVSANNMNLNDSRIIIWLVRYNLLEGKVGYILRFYCSSLHMPIYSKLVLYVLLSLMAFLNQPFAEDIQYIMLPILNN